MSRCTTLLLAILVGVAFSTVLPYDMGLRSRNPRALSSIEPVLARDFPDPTLIELDGLWYAFATSGNGYNVQAAVSWRSLWPNWRLQTSIPDPLPNAGEWTSPEPAVWAPDIIQLESGGFVLYYSAASAINASLHCVGAARAATILGPYEPLSKPLACPLSSGGAIDPAGFIDPLSGGRYIVYKVDGNSLDQQTSPCGGAGTDGYHPTPIMVQEVDIKDGVTLIGDAFEILDRGIDDGPLVEAPNLFYDRASKLYFLTFSSNCYSTSWYDIGYAYSTELKSTFTKANNTLMTSFIGPVQSPGGLCTTPDGTVGVFHGTVGYSSTSITRFMYMMRISVEANKLEVAQLL